MPTMTKQVEAMVGSVIEKWIIPHSPKFITTEEHVIHETYKYHGTFDALIEWEGSRWLVDWKTSNQFNDEMPLQLAGYARAWNWMYPCKPVQKGIIVRCDKKTFKVESREYPDLPKYYSTFLALRNVCDYVKKLGEWESQRRK